jgi:hypothetical protein
MCFLRPAQGFGWLDPSLKRSLQHEAPIPSPRASEGGTVVSTVKDTRTRNLSDKQTTLCSCTAETAMPPETPLRG